VKKTEGKRQTSGKNEFAENQNGDESVRAVLRARQTNTRFERREKKRNREGPKERNRRPLIYDDRRSNTRLRQSREKAMGGRGRQRDGRNDASSSKKRSPGSGGASRVRSTASERVDRTVFKKKLGFKKSISKKGKRGEGGN